MPKSRRDSPSAFATSSTSCASSHSIGSLGSASLHAKYRDGVDSHAALHGGEGESAPEGIAVGIGDAATAAHDAAGGVTALGEPPGVGRRDDVPVYRREGLRAAEMHALPRRQRVVRVEYRCDHAIHPEDIRRDLLGDPKTRARLDELLAQLEQRRIQRGDDAFVEVRHEAFGGAVRREASRWLAEIMRLCTGSHGTTCREKKNEPHRSPPDKSPGGTNGRSEERRVGK